MDIFEFGGGIESIIGTPRGAVMRGMPPANSHSHMQLSAEDAAYGAGIEGIIKSAIAIRRPNLDERKNSSRTVVSPPPKRAQLGGLEAASVRSEDRNNREATASLIELPNRPDQFEDEIEDYLAYLVRERSGLNTQSNECGIGLKAA